MNADIMNELDRIETKADIHRLVQCLQNGGNPSMCISQMLAAVAGDTMRLKAILRELYP